MRSGQFRLFPIVRIVPFVKRSNYLLSTLKTRLPIAAASFLRLNHHSTMSDSIDILSKAFQVKLNIQDGSVSNAAVVKELSGKFSESLTDFQSAEIHQWLTLSTRFPEGIDQLNESLKTRTYLASTQSPSLADIVVYSRIRLFVKQWSVEDIKAYRHIVRWFDLIQNWPQFSDVEKLNIDLDLEVPREIKPKPVKESKDGKDAKDGKVKEIKEKKPEVKAKEAEKAPEKATEKEAAAGAAPIASENKEKKKKEKKEKKPQPVKEEVPITPGRIDFRVGFIQKAIKHPDADTLYVSTIDVGDAEGPRTICSGLVNYYSLEDMQQRPVVVVANLKPANMRGIKSQGMVLCASVKQPDREVVEFVTPPAGSKPGDKIFFETFNSTPDGVLNPKKKIWEAIQPGFTTNEDLEVIYRKEGEPDRRLVLESGESPKVKSLVGVEVK